MMLSLSERGGPFPQRIASPIPRCLITGADLYNGSEVIHGDLHSIGVVYVFNAVGNRNGEAAWQAGPSSREELTQFLMTFKGLRIYPDTPVFERRGVIVIPMTSATLSPAAQKYLSINPQR